MKKVLIGMIIDGKAGGIDKYLMNFFDTVKGGDVQVDFLANRIDPVLKEQLAADGAGLYCVSGLRDPKAQYQQVWASTTLCNLSLVTWQPSVLVWQPRWVLCS